VKFLMPSVRLVCEPRRDRFASQFQGTVEAHVYVPGRKEAAPNVLAPS
jgi:hypothetical protein